MSNLKTLTVSKEELIKHEAEEIVRIIGRKPIEFVDYNLVDEVFLKTMRRYTGLGALGVKVSLSAVYYLGYIHGIQAERKRRKAK